VPNGSDKIPETSFSSKQHYATLRSHMIFETKSLLGRMLDMFRPSPRSKDFLNLGCGPRFNPNFTNVDFYAFRTKTPYVQHDLRFPLPFTDNTFCGVFSEHCIEHLHPWHAQKLFYEVFRVLRCNGVFRCVVPDLEKYVRFYNHQLVDPAFSRFTNGCEAIWSLTQNWGHNSVWDFEMLTSKLKDAGFAAVDLCGFRQGRLDQLLIDFEDRRWESLYVEGLKL
jgi:predicted SAM-dependent methyltransferase